MDLSGKGFLQCLEQGLDEVPLGAPHVDDDCEATFANVLTMGRSEFRRGHWTAEAFEYTQREAHIFLTWITLPTLVIFLINRKGTTDNTQPT